MKILILLLISNYTFAQEVKIKSNVKEAIVSFVNSAGEKKSIGKTPLDTTMDDLKSNVGDKENIQLQVSKDGFQSFNLILPLIGSSEINVMATLEVNQDIKLTQDVDLLIADLFDVLRMIRLKDYGSAFAKLDLLEKKFPYYSIIYEMKGMGHYLSKDFKKALNFYRIAFGLNPKNREAYKMKNYLEKKFNLQAKR